MHYYFIHSLAHFGLGLLLEFTLSDAALNNKRSIF